MLSESTISYGLIQAYLETHYHVYGDTPTVLKVAEANSALAALHRAADVNCSAFITAWNPYSAHQPPARNLELQQSLKQVLLQRGLRWVDGVGQHPTDNWPGEESLLVLGLALDDARALGQAFGQNAIVWCGPDAAPELVLLR